jgi:glycosyltransferase involved in cell wall biosynthesis
MKRPLLNILIRTSNRPNYFQRLMENIQSQKYKNYRLIISADTTETAKYVSKFTGENTTLVVVPRLERSPQHTFPWNLYLNTLMDHVSEGWIMFMDDDDVYADNSVFGLIASLLEDENSMLIWRLRFPDGRNVPAQEYMGKTPFTRKQIAMPCFAFHSKWKNHVRFDGQRAGDFRMACQLQQFLDVKWLDRTLVVLDNFGNVGKPVDLKNQNSDIK